MSGNNSDKKEAQELSLSEAVAEQIKQLIIDYKLESGDKIPNEFELANLLDVGRGSIREAVKLLVATNVLEIRRGRGTFVAKHIGQVNDPMGFEFYPDPKKLAVDLYETRLCFEPIMARLAAERADDNDLKFLWENYHLMREKILANEDFLPVDIKFHISIAKSTHNDVMPKLIPIITYSIGLFVELNAGKLVTEALTSHKEIIEAIEKHDPEAAEAAMRKHLLQNKGTLEMIKNAK